MVITMNLPEESIFRKIEKAILDLDETKLKEYVNFALDQKIPPIDIINKSITKALRIVGEKFENGELFLTHLIAAGEATQEILRIIEPELTSIKRKTLGKIILGTVRGDIHDIGKNIVGSMLYAAGFEIYDLGIDVPANRFVEKAKEINADIVGASALLSTTLPSQKEIIEAIQKEGIRNKIKVIFGGAPVTKEWVKEIGGDGYAENAIEAVRLVKKLLHIS